MNKYRPPGWKNPFKRGKWTDDATFETAVAGRVVFIPDEVKSGH